MMEEHAKWKYLLNSDGQAASWRLAKLLATNSVVLKYESDEVEYYYRSLRPGRHYIPFKLASLLPLLREQLPKQDSKMEQVAAEAQKFAYRCVSG